MAGKTGGTQLLRKLAQTLLIGATLAAMAAAQTDPRAEKLCGEANRIVDDLTTISGMARRHAVPCGFITKSQINEFLRKRIKESVKPEEIRAEELTLKKFGLVPRD